MEILKFLLVITITVCVVSTLVYAFDLIAPHFKSASKQEKEHYPNFYNTVLDDWIDRLFRDGITKIEKSEFYDYIQTTNYSVRFWNRNSDFFYAGEGAIMDTKGDIVLSWCNIFPSVKYSMKIKTYVQDYMMLAQENN